MSRIYKNKWNEWLLEFNKIMKNITEIKNAQECADDKIIINNFDNKKYKRFMILGIILRNKELIKNKINRKVQKEEPQMDIKIDESRKYIPRMLKRNETKIIKSPEWYVNIDWSQYKIGTTVIAEKRGFDKKITIIGNFCKECRMPFNDKGTICYQCDKQKYSLQNGLFCGGVPAPIKSNYNKCNNCCNLFKYNNEKDEYCNDCILDENEEEKFSTPPSSYKKSKIIIEDFDTCIIENCNNYVPVKGIACKSHL